MQSLVLGFILVLGGSMVQSDVLHPGLQKALKLGQENANVLITMKQSPSPILEKLKGSKFNSRAERLNAVNSALSSHSSITQSAVQSILSANPFISVASFSHTNQIYVAKAPASLVQALSRHPDIASIEEEYYLPLPAAAIDPSPEMINSAKQSSINGTVEWGVAKIQAPDAWAAGYNGSGIVVANIDTGVRWSHETLKARYIGDYGWYDPYFNPTLIFPPGRPSDGNGHGTHTMGTITGSKGIGVAPGATWMACRGCTTFGCSNVQLIACGEFMLCPRKWFNAKDCTKAPHLVSNSWGGGSGDGFYNATIDAWVTAGIIPIFAMGNAGPNCSSANSPGDQLNNIAVGATNINDTLAKFSSVGPTKDGKIKPDVAAPGVDVRSAYLSSDTSYATFSGTSMATPHTAGTVALMLSKNRNMTYTQVFDTLTTTTDRSTLVGSGQSCGGVSENAIPNNSFGYGRINALKAVTAVPAPA